MLVYKTRFVAPKIAVKVFVPRYNVVSPMLAQDNANIDACNGLEKGEKIS